ncbi:MAG: hypothetical protein IKJ78_00345 [Bacteroidales bacterium]|nr:hypothetical protein [Bacteroidales bacterium]
MKKTICFLKFVVCLVFLVSCGGHNIKTADQWVTYCDNEPNIHRCLETFDKIDFTTQCKIWDELTIIVSHLTVDDVKGRIKKDAWVYLLIYSGMNPSTESSTRFHEYVQSEDGKGQNSWDRYSRGSISDYKRACVVTLDRMVKLYKQYAAE